MGLVREGAEDGFDRASADLEPTPAGPSQRHNNSCGSFGNGGSGTAEHLIDVRQRILLWMRNRTARIRGFRFLVVLAGWRMEEGKGVHAGSPPDAKSHLADASVGSMRTHELQKNCDRSRKIFCILRKVPSQFTNFAYRPFWVGFRGRMGDL
ncbi:hypothetical protein [Sinorhizobium chiapasense]|uniref:Transposase n=1 Tax=Sinorhizobium chiapasense TaxID=501572 RepID=A0ABZ2BJ67_9HYPH